MKRQEEGQTHKHKRHSQKCCVVDTRAWPEADALPSPPAEGWDTELPFTLPEVPLHSSEMAAQLSPVKRTALWSLEPVPTITNNEAFSL